jgi:hypothetical protein
MATTKTTTLTFRVEPGLKEAVRTAAELEHQSIANMIEMMIRDYCGRKEIVITELDGLPQVSKKGSSAQMKNIEAGKSRFE